VARTLALKRETGALVLAHNYQRPEVQDLADCVGDSLELARRAAQTDARLVVMCGVRFMAETVAILAPDKTVLAPEPDAGCSLAATITGLDIRRWREAHPDGVVVAYVNTDAEVKAEADICCTSANANAVVTSVPAERDILFVPDQWLGRRTAAETGRDLFAWPGECHVHGAITTEQLADARAATPDALVLLHPEVPAAATLPPEPAIAVTGTGGMVRLVAAHPHGRYLVGTETGMLHPLARAAPEARLVAVNPDAMCDYMKTVTVPKLYRALRDRAPAVTVEPAMAARARIALERMLAIAE